MEKFYTKVPNYYAEKWRLVFKPWIFPVETWHLGKKAKTTDFMKKSSQLRNFQKSGFGSIVLI